MHHKILSKTVNVEQYLLEKIHSGALPPGSLIPSQHQLMSRCGCSRTTVLRALHHLHRAGYLTSLQGKGTFIRQDFIPEHVKEIIIIGKHQENSSLFPFSEMIFSLNTGDIPVRWLDGRLALKQLDSSFRPGQAVLWLLPMESQVVMMHILRERGIPQLLINRHYEDFDYVATNIPASYKEGLKWLKQEAGEDIVLIAHRQNGFQPYMNERLIAFYESCIEMNLQLTPGNLFKVDFSCLASEFETIGNTLFQRPRIPKGIFLLDHELAIPTILCAARYGWQLDRDYKLLIQDMVPELRGQKGFACIRQPFSSFCEGIELWLDNALVPSARQFIHLPKSDLLINGLPPQLP